MTLLRTTAAALALGTAGLGSTASADIQHLDDVIIRGSLCVGQDCINGENFSFDTLRLKENNLRLHFDDTSSSASFPNNDWRLTANDSSNGGGNYFAIEDATAGRTPFRVEAGARSNALYVDSQGDIGVGTNTPVTDIHTKTGDSPTLRLEQDGSSGFTPQTWDLAGNETNFFVRDVTNGSQLPFRIRPGADSNSLFIDSNNDVGVGTDSPDTNLHVRTTAAGGVVAAYDPSDLGHFAVENVNGTTAIRTMAALKNNGDISLNFINTARSEVWKLASLGGAFTILSPVTGGNEFSLSNDGNLTITGDFISGTDTLNVPDYVFEDSYELRPLSDVEAFIVENSHLPDIPSAKEIGAKGLNVGKMQMALLRKIEELTLYTLDQQKTITALNTRLDMLEK
ncbi:hypothetical protein [Neptunicoccus sediminis]|uniref:hypothetical protein n=1 Tax=Neptunicoccus sediminis TaxID=1892596 RepID=UPI000845E68F|nr:hypothetical protein [Neptunicoccus sediminis]